MKYNAEKKAEALARMAEIGVLKTGEKMGISAQTLYKWRNEGKNASAGAGRADDAGSLRKMIESERLHAAALQRLEDENAKLRDENKKLHRENSRLKVAVKAFIG